MQQTIDAIVAFMDTNPNTDWETLKAAVPYQYHQTMLEATRHLAKTGYLSREAIREDGKPNVILKKL